MDVYSIYVPIWILIKFKPLLYNHYEKYIITKITFVIKFIWMFKWNLIPELPKTCAYIYADISA